MRGLSEATLRSGLWCVRADFQIGALAGLRWARSMDVNNHRLPAEPLRGTIRDAYRAADAGHPETGLSKLAAEPASLADMLNFF